MADEVGYVLNGPAGRTCADCSKYEPSPESPEVGKCSGFDVKASAGCNYFKKKADRSDA